jgi:DNA-binding XRE family transcriptional regulator
MHTTVKQILASRSQDELIEAATALADADLRMRKALIEARRSAGLSQSEVAEALGIKQSSVAAFERYDNDPRLSTIRRYAIVVGAQIEHEVRQFSFGGDWKSFTTNAGMSSRRASEAVAYPAPTRASSLTLAA